MPHNMITLYFRFPYVTHVPWFKSGSLIRGGGENVPDIPGACPTRNFTYLIKRACRDTSRTVSAQIRALLYLVVGGTDRFYLDAPSFFTSSGAISEATRQ